MNIKIMVFLLGFLFSFARAEEVIPGCEGESCSCFQAYKSSKTKGAPGNFDIETIRNFSLYKEKSKSSKLIGKFNSGIKARPILHEIVVEEKGEYVVEKIISKKISLKVGDKIDTMINLGEGSLKARNNGRWIEFEYDDPKLKTVKETMLNVWLKVRLKNFEGYTQDSPFEMCLE